MSKKHYIALAQTIRGSDGSCEPFSELQIELLPDFCGEQNPRFNRERWIDYINGKCGPNGGSVK